MTFEDNIKEIRRLYNVLFRKEVAVSTDFLGTELGNKERCWHVKCENREAYSSEPNLAAQQLVKELQKELSKKISSIKNEAIYLESQLQSSCN